MTIYSFMLVFPLVSLLHLPRNDKIATNGPLLNMVDFSLYLHWDSWIGDLKHQVLCLTIKIPHSYHERLRSKDFHLKHVIH